MKLVVVGSSNMDLVISLPRIPAVGETVLGGKSAYAPHPAYPLKGHEKGMFDVRVWEGIP